MSLFDKWTALDDAVYHQLLEATTPEKITYWCWHYDRLWHLRAGFQFPEHRYPNGYPRLTA